ncbi:C80 family cysteine peptidase [Aestuariispira insulae]|uniref:Peptidase C80-like protein n=1 Tax=Aestuariispira insulae TaxID=1461337 RepID=A0A3D9H2L5_9PROT|nr:C80 family cysteine peptidase [Aestuariispira insulae]RED43725.1 peptidase C80-like protein [Aestuariispira insulae]
MGICSSKTDTKVYRPPAPAPGPAAQVKIEQAAVPGVKISHSLKVARAVAPEKQQEIEEAFLNRFEGKERLLAKIKKNLVVSNRLPLKEKIANFEQARTAAGKAQALHDLGVYLDYIYTAFSDEGGVGCSYERRFYEGLKQDFEMLVTASARSQKTDQYRSVKSYCERHHFSEAAPLQGWVKPDAEIMAPAQFRLPKNGYGVRLVLQAQNDDRVLKNVINLTGKHPENTIVAQWDPKHEAIRVVHHPVNCPYVENGKLAFGTGKEAEGLPFPRDWKLTLVAHGDEAAQVAGLKGDELAASFMKMADAHFEQAFPKKIALMSCQAARDGMDGAASKFMERLARADVEHARSDPEIHELKLSAFTTSVGTSIDGRKKGFVNIPGSAGRLTINGKIQPEAGASDDASAGLFASRVVEYRAHRNR